MNPTNFLLPNLVKSYSHLRPQIYFKSSLLALARAMEDLVIAGDDSPLVIANFQQERFFRPQEQRFHRIAQKTNQVYVLAVPNDEFGFVGSNSIYETVPLGSTDTLAREKFLIIVGQHYSVCLVGREIEEYKKIQIPIEQGKRFEGFWTFDFDITQGAAQLALDAIAVYRPELNQKIARARSLYFNHRESNQPLSQHIDVVVFTQRLVTYLQAAKYKLLKAYKTIAVAERKESLINKITQAQRQSLDPQEILEITVRELGQIFPQCRCILYRVNPNEIEVTIKNEFAPANMPSLLEQKWSVADNPVFIVAQTQNSPLVISDVANNAYLQKNSILKEKIERAKIDSWLMVAIRYQNTLLGVLELHHSGEEKLQWNSEDVAVVEAVANNVGVALTQASAYTNLVELNEQLEAVERIQNNLIAVVGHELRTPITTIQICLETLATGPNMPRKLRNSMLEAALSDSERLAQLVQNILTLSKLEAGKAYRDIEPISLEYVMDLAIRQVKNSFPPETIPKINVELSDSLPCVLADVEGLVEAFSKVLDNACKFTPSQGNISITAQVQKQKFSSTNNSASKTMLEVVIADTGRGIEASQLERIFDRFSQSESYLRRTTNGVGLGLVICRKIINTMGGQIWAHSKGKNQGSQFCFMIPIDSLVSS